MGVGGASRSIHIILEVIRGMGENCSQKLHSGVYTVLVCNINYRQAGKHSLPYHQLHPFEKWLVHSRREKSIKWISRLKLHSTAQASSVPSNLYFLWRTFSTSQLNAWKRKFKAGRFTLAGSYEECSPSRWQRKQEHLRMWCQPGSRETETPVLWWLLPFSFSISSGPHPVQ